MPKSLLFIGFFDSPHFARWIENVLESTDYELTIFCSSPARSINPYLHRLISKNESRLRISKHSPKNPFFAYLLDKMPLVNQRSKALKSEIGKGHDIVHYFEMQHSGYLLLPLISELRDEKVVYSNYGSDIFWFRKYKGHRKKMEKVLSVTDLVFYECERDLDFLRNHCPQTADYVWTINSGGLRDMSKSSDSNDRDIILIKGYSNKWGRAVSALRIVLRSRRKLKRYQLRIVVYSCDIHVPIIYWLTSILFGLRVKTYRKGQLRQEEVLGLMRKSLIHLGISKSDGIPASVLEAMSQGSVPVQSSSACIEQLIIDGESGFILDSKLADLDHILDLLETPFFRQKAESLNAQSIQKFYDARQIAKTAAKSYECIRVFPG